MPTATHGRPIIHVAPRPEIAKKIWRRLRSIEDKPWDMPKNKQKLGRLIGHDRATKIYDIKNSHQQNRDMRKIISNTLKRAPLDKKREMGNWIVHDWGRITRGRKSSVDWTYDLGSFAPRTTRTFIDRLHKKRISSWSKILAFADQRNHAIYDSRTSVSLNVILDAIGNPHRFYMPPARNKAFPEVIQHMKKWAEKNIPGPAHSRYRTYHEYIELLNSIKIHCDVKDIMEIEMRLFALAEDFAKTYAEKYRIHVEEFEKQKLETQQTEMNFSAVGG